LLAVAREQDTVARLGGDEFVLVLTSLKDFADAGIVAERIAQGLSGEYEIQDRVLSVTCSIGISVFPEHGEDGEALIKNADAAMYCSKDEGRNRFRFFTAEMNAQAVDRLVLENSLRSAVEKQQLFLMYQPEIDIATGKITCWEALARWRHPQIGLVPPDKFIRIAENNGSIVEIGEWVLRTACTQARRWYDAGLLDVPVAVNVSAVQFRQEGFCEMVRSVIEQTKLHPRFLELELTESLLLSNQDVMFQVLGELKTMGVRLAIDDFGTGYSSLSYLRQFPVSKLKIDRSFIREIAVNGDDEAITAAIINMAKCLNLDVTAEGVETDAQLELLRMRGCDEAQGYLFSKPLLPDAVTIKLRDILPSRVNSAQT
jgi:predicted signal transduction protein with EAL and GGDEF domain